MDTRYYDNKHFLKSNNFSEHVSSINFTLIILFGFIFDWFPSRFWLSFFCDFNDLLSPGCLASNLTFSGEVLEEVYVGGWHSGINISFSCRTRDARNARLDLINLLQKKVFSWKNNFACPVSNFYAKALN